MPSLVILILALLVGHAATGFAGRLARGLAFAAAAVLCALTEVAGLDGLDSFHGFISILSVLIFICSGVSAKAIAFIHYYLKYYIK